MLRGRVAPPASPAVDGPSRSLPVSRRNSFSHDTIASITQTCPQSTINAALGQNIHLHVSDALRPLSPRKTASFSLPRTPQQDDADPPRSLRPSLSDIHLRRLLDSGNDTASRPQSLSLAARLVEAAHVHREDPKLSANLDNNEDDDNDDDHTSSSYSPVSAARDESGEEEESDNDGSDCDPVVDDPDAFEAWLQEARISESPVTVARRDDVVSTEQLLAYTTGRSSNTPALLCDSTASLALSKSVQQIEHEIRLAIESAASRVSGDRERHESFTRELHDHVAMAPPSSRSDSEPSSFPPTTAAQLPVQPPAAQPLTSASESELLLLMEVLIGDGRSETIEIHVGDQPDQLAQAFAARHGLPTEAIPRLTQHIQDQLDALEDEDQEKSGDHARDSGEQREIAGGYYKSGLQDERHTSSFDIDRSDDDEEGFPDDRSAFDNFDGTKALQFQSEQRLPQPHDVQPPTQQREYEREHKYNHLMEKYGHYTSHSNKVNPTAQAHQAHPHHQTKSELSLERHEDHSDPLTMRHVELSEHARLMFKPRPAAFSASNKRQAKDKESVYQRLYGLAEAREKWIRRQQKAKAADEVRERQAMMKLDISSKSRDMVAGRGNGGYAHIGERLYDEALHDLAKKQRECEKREFERAEQVDWTCPKCAFMNQHQDAVCKNVVAAVMPPPAPALASSFAHDPRLSNAALLDAHPEVVCGYPRPEELFRPTLIVTPASVTRAVHQNKLRATASAASSQRQRTQQQMEDEFRQTCPFKPTINEVSEEIMRDKLEQEAKAGAGPGGGIKVTPTGDVRRKNPHQALYEDAFHARAQREAREEAYVKQFPFKPNIGVNALWSKHSGDDADVVERLAVSKYQELERKRQSLYEKYAPDRDPTTGREYFKPETGRAPIFNRNERGLPIGEFLYEAHKEQEEYLRRLRQQEHEQMRQRSEQGFVSDKSKRAIEARKKKTFARLFDWLLTVQQPPQELNLSEPSPPRSEQRVLPSALDLDAMPSEISRIMSIVVEFANHEPFTFAEFELYMQKLMEEVPGLTYTQVLFVADTLNDGKTARRPVERGNRSDADDASLTFRPTIDKNSDALAKKHGRSDRSSVFEALNQYYDHYKERQAQTKKQREREFVRTHPFQPRFVTKDRAKKAAKFYDKLHHQEMATTIGEAAYITTAKDSTPSLRTAVPNARPFVRPLGRTPSDQTLRSRCSSVAGDGDDDDAVLTSHVLAALDDRASLSPTGHATPSAAPRMATTGSALSTLFSATSTSVSSSVSSAAAAIQS